MDEVDRWISELEGPPPLSRMPEIEPETRRVPFLVGALALAAVAGFALLPVAGPSAVPALRGVSDPGVPSVDLRLAVEGAGGPERVRHGGQYSVGQRVLFRVSSAQPATVWVWVERDAEVVPVAEVAGRPEPVDVQAPGGLRSYTFDSPGAHVFKASSEGLGTCLPESCVTVSVEVTP